MAPVLARLLAGEIGLGVGEKSAGQMRFVVCASPGGEVGQPVPAIDQDQSRIGTPLGDVADADDRVEH